MAFNKNEPTGDGDFSLRDDAIRANFAAIETCIGQTNLSDGETLFDTSDGHDHDGTDSKKLGLFYDYGTSSSQHTERAIAVIKICYGAVSVAQSSSKAITNLPFTSASTYVVTIVSSEATPSKSLDKLTQVIRNSGSQFTIYNEDGDAGTLTVQWTAIGI